MEFWFENWRNLSLDTHSSSLRNISDNLSTKRYHKFRHTKIPKIQGSFIFTVWIIWATGRSGEEWHVFEMH
jgi:hypothetical protein